MERLRVMPWSARPQVCLIALLASSDDAPTSKRRRRPQRRPQTFQILLAVDLVCAERFEMGRDVLRVEKREPTIVQVFNKVHQRYFRRITHAMEHRLPKECAPQDHPI